MKHNNPKLNDLAQNTWKEKKQQISDHIMVCKSEKAHLFIKW